MTISSINERGLEQIGDYLDNGHYMITAKRAGMLCGSAGVPRHGYERCVEYRGLRCWVARTQHRGKTVWTVRVA